MQRNQTRDMFAYLGRSPMNYIDVLLSVAENSQTNSREIADRNTSVLRILKKNTEISSL